MKNLAFAAFALALSFGLMATTVVVPIANTSIVA